MPARQKLNGVSLYICLVLGAVAAAASGSGVVFVVTTGMLLLIAMHTGALRLEGNNKRK